VFPRAIFRKIAATARSADAPPPRYRPPKPRRPLAPSQGKSV